MGFPRSVSKPKSKAGSTRVLFECARVLQFDPISHRSLLEFETDRSLLWADLARMVFREPMGIPVTIPDVIECLTIQTENDTVQSDMTTEHRDPCSLTRAFHDLGCWLCGELEPPHNASIIIHVDSFDQQHSTALVSILPIQPRLYCTYCPRYVHVACFQPMMTLYQHQTDHSAAALASGSVTAIASAQRVQLQPMVLRCPACFACSVCGGNSEEQRGPLIAVLWSRCLMCGCGKVCLVRAFINV